MRLDFLIERRSLSLALNFAGSLLLGLESVQPLHSLQGLFTQSPVVDRKVFGRHLAGLLIELQVFDGLERSISLRRQFGHRVRAGGQSLEIAGADQRPGHDGDNDRCNQHHHKCSYQDKSPTRV